MVNRSATEANLGFHPIVRSQSLVSGKRTLFSIAALRKSLLVRNALWLLLGSGLRASIQGIYFVLIARALGPDGYGAFAGVVALVALASPFSGLGMGNILIKNVARDRETFGESWGTGVVAVALSGDRKSVV